MVEWGKAPWALRAYVVLTVGGAVVTAVTASSTPVAPLLFFVAFEAVVGFFLLRGVRWLWLVTIAFLIFGFVLGVVESNLKWWGIAEGVVALVLLTHPTTRRYFAKPERDGGEPEVSVSD